MATENKTQQTDDSVLDFLNGIENKTRREDGLAIMAMMNDITGVEPKLWGSIVGYGCHHYKYDSGREGDMPLVGFSPRKQSMTLYIMPGFEQYEALLSRLGKHKLGKSCLYLNKLADVDQEVLRKLVSESYQHMKETNDQ